MSLLFRGAETRSISTADWIRGLDSTSKSLSGERVGFDTAIGLDAVAAVVGLFCDMAYMLPVDSFEQRDGPADPKVAHPLLVSSPSLTVDAPTWRSQAMVSWLLWGNAYGLIMARDNLGYPTMVEWLDPGSVTVTETSITRQAAYEINGRAANADDILHVPGRFVRPGSRVGLVPLERFKETFGLALAARNFGARWFGDGAHPSALLTTDQPVNQEQAATIKERFMAAVKGKREPVVMGAGMKYTPVQSTPADSELSLTRTEATIMVARSMGLSQPEMIGAASSGSSVTYANREQRAIDFLTFSADPWLVRFENLWERNTPPGQYSKFNRGALLRTDLSTRYASYKVGIDGKFLTPDEARELEDRGPLSASNQMDSRSLAEALQKIYLAVGVVISPDEAREILNREGAGLTGSLPSPGGQP